MDIRTNFSFREAFYKDSVIKKEGFRQKNIEREKTFRGKESLNSISEKNSP